MQYMVTGVDGKEYGPTDIATLKTWVAEGRLAPHSMLRDFLSGQTMPASSLSELFPVGAIAVGAHNVPPVGMGYPRVDHLAASDDFGGGAFTWVVVRAVGGILLFFVLHGIGLIIAGSGLVTAFQLKSSGSKYGLPSIIIASIAVVIIGIGWAIRLSTSGA
jgi:hypothetical protein